MPLSPPRFMVSTALLGSPEHATLVRLSMIGVAGFAAQLVMQGIWAGYADVRAPFTYAVTTDPISNIRDGLTAIKPRASSCQTRSATRWS